MKSLSILWAVACLAQPQSAAGVKYKASFPEAAHHIASIEVTFFDAPAPLEVRMSRSSPGRYAVHEFAKNVFDVQAFDGKGRPLPLQRPNAHQWDVAGHDGTVRMTYKVFGNEVDGTYLGIDTSHAHMNMPATFMWARGLEKRPIEVTFEPSPGWKAATQLFPTTHPFRFTAPNLQYFMDSPTELSAFSDRSFTVKNPDGKEYTVRAAVHHDGPESAVDEYVAGMKRIVAEQAAIFGEYPDFETGRYTFLGDYLPWGGGDGMEHRNSTVVASRTSFKNPGVASRVLGTVSHEFFHAWNIERIRPKSLEPFNFEDANVSGELWLGEGFTQYYGDLTMARAGLEPAEEVLSGLARTGVGVAGNPARHLRSVVEMSQLAPFVDAATSIDQNNFGYSFISYYTYGAALALALDLELRIRSAGKVSLDDYMKTMWHVHGKPQSVPGLVDRPYTLADAQSRLAEVSGDRAFAQEFFDRYIHGREIPDYARLLKAAGVEVKARSDEGWTGMRLSGPRVMGLVGYQSPAFAAGIEEGDTILSIDGIAYSAAALAKKPGDTAVFEVRRPTGETFRTSLKFGSNPTYSVRLLTGGELTPEMTAFRQRLLGSKAQKGR